MTQRTGMAAHDEQGEGTYDRDTLDGGPPAFLPSIADFWHPSASPAFEARLQGWSLFFYLLLRKVLVCLLLPIRAILVLCGSGHVPSKPTWTTKQRILIPALNHYMWAVVGLGSPPEETFDGRRDIPASAQRRYGGPSKVDGRAVTADQLDLPLMDAERAERWLLPASEGGVLDPTGLVKPERVPCYSFWREPLQIGGTAFSMSRPGERVILYLIGGGYVQGTPMEERVWTVCRKTGLRVIAPNFRKATHPSRAFPAALQDALLTYAHLVDKLRVQSIILMGDSAGGGLCLALAQALARLPEAQTDPALTPTHLVLHSPFTNMVDFTLPSFDLNQDIDMLNLSMLAMSSHNYGQNLLAHPLPAHDPHFSSPWHPTQLRRHPYISPALESSVDSLSRCLKTARRGGPRVMLTWGSAELFADSCKQMLGTLKAAGWRDEDVEVVVGRELTHVWAAFPESLAPQVKEMWVTLRTFLELDVADAVERKKQ